MPRVQCGVICYHITVVLLIGLTCYGLSPGLGLTRRPSQDINRVHANTYYDMTRLVCFNGKGVSSIEPPLKLSRNVTYGPTSCWTIEGTHRIEGRLLKFLLTIYLCPSTGLVTGLT